MPYEWLEHRQMLRPSHWPSATQAAFVYHIARYRDGWTGYGGSKWIELRSSRQ